MTSSVSVGPGTRSVSFQGLETPMPALLIIAIIVGLVLLFSGIFVGALKFLLWVGLVIVILAIIGWLLRSIRGRA